MPASAIYCIDVGDLSLRGGFHLDGITTEVATVATPHATRITRGDDALMASIEEMVDRIAAEAPPVGALAVSASGIMTLQPNPGARDYGPFRDAELYVLAPNVDGLKYVPFLSMLEDLGLGVPVHVENDVNAALRSSDVDDAVCISLGAGLGAAVKRGGRIQHVPGSWSAYEIGHGMRWDLPEAVHRRCHCGNNGCLEAVIGGWAMTERYRVSPERASTEIYAQMRDDVVEYLPMAIADVVRQSGIGTVVMGGRGSVGYWRGPDFAQRLAERVAASVDPSIELNFQLMELGETAELHGMALAMVDYVDLTVD